MKKRAYICGLVLFHVCLFAPLWIYAGNSNYINNRSPLTETPFIQLPLGSVTAEGWLLKQLELQRDGLTGYAEELYNGNNDLGVRSDWLGNFGDSWERVPYYVKGLVPLAYLLIDQTLIEKAKKWIDWSLNNQTKTGFFGPPRNDDWWPRMPMLYAIRDYYEATNDERVIPFMTKYFEYQYATIDSKPLRDWGKSRAGDNIEIVLWLYNRTGDAFLLELSDKLKNQAYNWTNIFTYNKFMDFGADFQPKHNVNVPQAMKMPAIYSQKSKNQADIDAYRIGREHLMCDHGQPHGMQSGNEMLGGRSSMTGTELCSIVEQMQTSETVQMILGDPRIGDELEQVAFNALPGIMTKDIKGMQYYTQVNQVQSKYGGGSFGQGYQNGLTPSPFSGYGCCRFNMHMGWPYFVKTLWAATNDNGLAAMAYAPCKVTAKVGNNIEVTIVEDTNYPFEEELRFTVTTSQPVTFPLKLRIPGWCKNPAIKVNGTAQTDVKPGEFYTINRTWKNNDAVVLEVPMEIRLNEEVNNSVSVHRGPLVFSLKMKERWEERSDWGNGFKEYEVFPENAWNYGLAINKTNLENAFSVIKSAMPENPFVQSSTPVSLKVKAKKIPEWGYALNNQFASDPTFGPVESSEPEEEISLVPFGAENIRLTCFPLIGTPTYIDKFFEENFDTDRLQGWVNYNGSFMLDNNEYFATNTEGYSGSKSVQTATLFSDLIYDFKVKIENSGDGGVIFRAGKLSFGADEYNGYYVGISAANQCVLLGKADGNWHHLTSAEMKIQTNTWYQVRIEAVGANIKVFVDDMNTPKITYTDFSYTKGCIGVRCYNAITRWDNLRVTEKPVEYSQLTNLPTIYLDTNGKFDFVDKEHYVPSKVIISNASSINTYNADVRGRGNSTWLYMEKKPFRIKFNSKQHFLGLPANNKSWTLLACAVDKTFLRNGLAFEMSHFLGFEFTPACVFVDVVLDGSYYGTYVASDHINVDKDRININEMVSSDVGPTTITGGYQLKIDAYANDEPVHFWTNRGIPFTVKNPDEGVIVPAQFTYIQNYVNDLENTLFQNPDLACEKYIDIESAVKYYLHSELTGNCDSYWCIPCYKKRGDDKLYFGPVWDYDQAFLTNYRVPIHVATLDTEHGYAQPWFRKIMQTNAAQKELARLWKKVKDGNLQQQLLDYADRNAALLQQSQKLNYERWNSLNRKVWFEDALFDTYDEYIDFVKKFIVDRIAWYDEFYPGEKKNILLPSTPNNPLQTWQYTFDTPPNDWYKTSFDDSKWQSGKAPFGTERNLQNTLWTTDQIYIRTRFYVNKDDLDQLEKTYFYLFHDEDCWIYLNDRLAFTVSSYNTNYQTFEFDKSFLQEGWNTIAIKCIQTVGGQLIDVGIFATVKDEMTKDTSVRQMGKYNCYVRDSILHINQIESGVSVKLYSIDGRLVKQQTVTGSEIQIPLLQRGIYLVNLSGETVKVMY